VCDAREMGVEEFRDELRESHSPSPEQQQYVDRLLALYSERGLLPDGRDEPLYGTCPHRDPCWANADRPSAQDAGISVPWVGRNYVSARICVVGLNFHNYGGLAAHWRVCRSHIEALQAGGQGKNGEFFATGAMSYARAIEMSMSGQLTDGWETPSPPELASTWDRCSYLQAVKCAPSGYRSRPTGAMCRTCPPFLLKAELDILAPSAIILLGRTSVRDVVRPMLDCALGRVARPLRAGRVLPFRRQASRTVLMQPPLSERSSRLSQLAARDGGIAPQPCGRRGGPLLAHETTARAQPPLDRRTVVERRLLLGCQWSAT